MLMHPLPAVDDSMEIIMDRTFRRSRVLAAIFALTMLASCAEETSSVPPQQQKAVAAEPQLAGAWYQIYFDTKSSKIGERGQLIVDTVANVVAHAGPTRVTVIGKTDRVGAPPANLELSEQRAKAVRDALIAAGIQAAQIDTSWTGEAKQEVATANNVTEQRNRVVDVTVVQEMR